MISKFFRFRFLIITFLSIISIIFIVLLYYKSVYDFSLLSKSRNGNVQHKMYDIADVNKLMNNNKYVPRSDENEKLDNENNYISNNNECMMIDETNSTIKTVDMFSSFNFKADWVGKRKGIWQNDFENRYIDQMKNDSLLPLKVFILPHSHTDPGWLQTFTSYYEKETRKILDLIVEKLTKHEDMRFIWTEISFLNLWWQHASSSQKKSMEQLVKSGRLEIMTGGWVMTDEANVHLYAMLDQLIEGHQWVKSKFNVAPKIGWSIDPFGQGSTVPHLLAKSGFEGAIIQRIHYNWKEWLARHQYGDFFWKTYWSNNKSSEYTLLTHNMPFDIYSTRHSCGPQPKECDNFDFSIRGAQKFNGNQIKDKADTLIQQYAKTASLFPHNVALVLMGSDFTFQDEKFFNDHYFGYEPLIKFVNENSNSRYNGATIQYGTPSEYFDEIKKRLGNKFPSLIGDFFPYSDIFSSGTPAYWTGYFTTRPFHKFMSRDLEHNLRNSEILFTIVMNKIRQQSQDESLVKEFNKKYLKIIEARRNLGLFQHHDAITGTSKRAVMKDYLIRLHKSVKDVISIQQESIEYLLQPDVNKFENSFLEHELQRDNPEQWPTQKILKLTNNKSERIVIFNSLAQKRIEVVSITVSTPHIKITTIDDIELPYQINPIFNGSYDYEPSNDKYQLIFIAELLPMSLNTYKLKFENDPKTANISCKICSQSKNQASESGIKIENSKMSMDFDQFGFLSEVKLKDVDKIVKINVIFGAYKSVLGKSGAYLFKPKNEQVMSTQNPKKIFIIEGPIASDVTIIYGEILSHTIRIFNTKTYLDDAISIINDVNFENVSKNRDVEMIMKLKTSIDNSQKSGQPEFFTDQNGFQWQPRRKVSQLGVEGNYYPITTSMFIQDDSTRLTLVTTHAQGATSFQNGELEVMLDRRPTFDDSRGMGEGVFDSVKMQHKFWLALESFPNDKLNTSRKYQVPSIFAHHLINTINYPVNTFISNTELEIQFQRQIQFFNNHISCDTHLINLRSVTDANFQWDSSPSSLLILHRLGYDCTLSNENFWNYTCLESTENSDIQFVNDLKIKHIHEASLTALQLKKQVYSFNSMSIVPMEIKTYLVTYQ